MRLAGGGVESRRERRSKLEKKEGLALGDGTRGDGAGKGGRKERKGTVRRW